MTEITRVDDQLDLTDPDVQIISYSELSTGMIGWGHAQREQHRPGVPGATRGDRR